MNHDDVILRALAEDAPWGDVTSEAFLPAGAVATGQDDAAVVHGFGGLEGIRERALAVADSADEEAYLGVFLDEREIEMRKEAAHEDTTRVSTAQRVFLEEGNLQLDLPLSWHVYGDPYRID